MQVKEKVGKSPFVVFCPMICGSGGRKIGSLKRRVRSQLARCTPLWHEAHFQVKMYKTLHSQTSFGSWDVTKSTRRCGTKHISKSKCTKHTNVRPLLEVEMSKKCTPLWREAYFQVKSVKNCRVWTTFGRSDVVLRGRGKGLCTSSQVRKTWGVCSSFNCNYNDNMLHYIILHHTTLHYTTQHNTTLHYTTPHYTIHYTTLHYTPLHYITLH